MKLLVTGADGFVGGWLVRRLLAEGHSIAGTHRKGARASAVLTPVEAGRIEWRELELSSADSVRAACGKPGDRWDAVIHLAALASGSEARENPGLAWDVNAGGTARLCEVLTEGLLARQSDPVFLLVSTGEVYGEGSGTPRRESDPALPCSPYAASKLGAEIAALECARRAGLRVIVARPFTHSGPAQDLRFVLPALASRLRAAKRIGVRTIKTGNLEPVRDFLDVRDVIEAYLTLLARGSAGEIYNIASGEGHRLLDLLRRLERLAGWKVTPELDERLARRSDLAYLVGNAGKLHRDTGWERRIALPQTLQDLLDAQAD